MLSFSGNLPQQSQTLGDIRDEVLHVGDDAAAGEAAPVHELVHGEFRNVHAVEVHGADGAVGQYPVARGHVARGDGVQHGGHADDRGGRSDVVAHGILGIVGIAEHAGQGAIVADGTGEHIGHVVAHKRLHDAVAHALLFDEPLDASPIAHAVDGVQMVVMAVGAVLLGLDVLAQRRVEVGAFQIVGGQGVAGEHRIGVAGIDDLGEGIARKAVEREGRPHDPHDKAVVALVAQKLVELVVVAGEGRLATSAETEGEVVVASGVGRPVLGCGQAAEALGVHEDALLTVLGAPAGDQVAGADVAEFTHEHRAVFHHGHAVHAGVPSEHPFPVDFQVLGIDGHGVVVLGRYEILRRGHEGRVRRGN